MFADSITAAMSGVIEQLQSSQVQLSYICAGSVVFCIIGTYMLSVYAVCYFSSFSVFFCFIYFATFSVLHCDMITLLSFVCYGRVIAAGHLA